MTVIDLGEDTEESSHIWSLDEALVKKSLSIIVEFVWPYSPGNTDTIVTLLSKYVIEDFSEPPNTYV